MELFKRGLGVVPDADSVSIQPKYVDCQKFVDHLDNILVSYFKVLWPPRIVSDPFLFNVIGSVVFLKFHFSLVSYHISK